MRTSFILVGVAFLGGILAGCAGIAPPSASTPVSAPASVSASAPAVPPDVSRELQELHQGQADLSKQLQHLQDNMVLAEGRLQDQQQMISNLRATLLAQKVTPYGEKAGGPAQGAPSGTTAGKPATPTETYLRAFADYASGHYPQAIDGFQTFLRLYSGNDYAGHALYWLGECYYSLQQYAAAAEAFQKAIDQYPHSAKAPDALLKLAATLKQMNRNDRAGEVLKQLQERYPDSAAAHKAQGSE